MYKKLSIFLLSLFVLAGCNPQQTIRADGTSEHWNAQIIFELTDTHQQERGGIQYTGDEELISVTYDIQTRDGSIRKGETHPVENQTAVSFGTSTTNHPATKEGAIFELNHASINITWKTKSGEFAETVEMSVD